MHNTITLTLAAVAIATFSLHAQVLLQDNFNDNKLDGTKWRVVTKGIPGKPAVYERNKRIELVNRGYLVSQKQFDPSKIGGIRITGKWTFVKSSGDFDIMRIVTRSDATPSGRYGEVRSGLVFTTSLSYSPKSFIAGISNPGIKVGSRTWTGSLKSQVGRVYHFEILDTRCFARFTITDPVTKAFTTASVSIIQDATTTKHIVFYNRERIFGDKVAYLDDVVVSRVAGGSLCATTSAISVASGGSATFLISAGQSHARKFYLLLGSMSGTTPGVRVGSLTLPLNPDSYFAYTAGDPGGLIRGSLGILDLQGRGSAKLVLPPKLATPFVGRTLNHAYLVLRLGPQFDSVSNAVPLKLVK